MTRPTRLSVDPSDRGNLRDLLDVDHILFNGVREDHATTVDEKEGYLWRHRKDAHGIEKLRGTVKIVWKDDVERKTRHTHTRYTVRLEHTNAFASNAGYFKTTPLAQAQLYLREYDATQLAKRWNNRRDKTAYYSGGTKGPTAVVVKVKVELET